MTPLPYHRRGGSKFGTLTTVHAADHLSDLATRGWTWTDDASIYTDIARELGGSEVRRQLLRPTHASAARRGSHSATVGLARFPWHTDGAIALEPPRWMVLRCLEADRPTSTEFCLPDAMLSQALCRLTILIRQENGRKAYIPAMIGSTAGDYRIRWDPRSTTLGPDLALKAVEGAMPSGELSWKPGRILVVDNHRVLHRRPAVTALDGRVIERTFLV